MKGARVWVIAALVSIAIAAAVSVFQAPQDSPEHSSNSDAANGASAARLFAQAMGHPTDQIAGTFALPPHGGGAMFVFSPTSPYTSDEADRTRLWVQSGGVLIYASEHGDTELDRALGVRRLGSYAFNDKETGNPVVPGVTSVAGAGRVMPLYVAPGQVPFLRTQNGAALGYIQPIEGGVVVVLADPLVLCNGYLDKQDNGRLLADLLAVGGSSSTVVFDEYHHGVILSDFAPQAWLMTPWGVGLLWLLVAVFAGLLLRGRSFGPLIQRPAEAARADVEWAVAVGQLLRRSSARALTLGLLASATERAVSVQTGIPLQPRERFWNALWVRVPQLAAELAEAESVIYTSAAGEADLLKAAQRLHEIARPVPPARTARVAR
jgi:hypothetical protein